jgi:hypothetical protein
MPEGPGGIVPAEFIPLASGERVMVCRTTVQRGGVSTPVTLFLPQPGDPALSRNDLEAVVGQDPVIGVPAVLEASGTGEATVTVRPADVPRTEFVAMAAAVCAASWGWDESGTIRVIVNDASLMVTARYAGVNERWHATIVAATDAPVRSRDAAI